MTGPVNDQDLMRYLDGELAPDERARVEEALDASPELREQLDAFRSLRSEFHELTFPDASCDRSIWHRVAAHVAGRSGRGFFLAGVTAWLVYAVFVLVAAPHDAWEKLGVAAVAIGILALFAAVIRDRYRSWSDEP